MPTIKISALPAAASANASAVVPATNAAGTATEKVTLAQIAALSPVQSVNGQTGEVTVASYSLPTATASVLGGVKIGSGITITDGVISASAGDSVSIAASASDVLSASTGSISADDPGADRIIFWDDSAGKLTHLEVGSGLTISGTTLTASGGGGGGGSTSASDLTSGTLSNARLTARARAAINVFNWFSFR